jgi:hypothetical protein
LKIPKKNRTPQTSDRKKPYFGLLPTMARKRGTNATQARKETSNAGKDRINNTAEKTAKRISFNITDPLT